MEGDLTIHGVTGNVTLDVQQMSAPHKDPWGNMRIEVSATTQINRRDFGLTWNPRSGRRPRSRTGEHHSGF